MALLMAELAADSRQESRPRADQGEKQVSLRIPDTEAGRDWLARYASEYEPAESLVVGPRLVIRAFEGFQKGEIRPNYLLSQQHRRCSGCCRSQHTGGGRVWNQGPTVLLNIVSFWR